MKPKSYEFINMYNSAYAPSTVHCKNTGLVNYFTRYLLQKVISVFEFKGIPETWPKNYFEYVLLGYGYGAVFMTDRYGLMFNQCSLHGYNVFYQPNKVLVANPFLNMKELTIGQDCEIIRFMPDYGNIMDLVSVYADLMALCLETSGINLLNSKMSYVFFAEQKSIAESFKKMYDTLASGEPMAVVDRELLNEDGTPRWQLFLQNVGQNYITDKVLNDMETLENQFNTAVGIPNANTQKRERLISDEVNANNIDTQSRINLYIEQMNDDMKRVNNMYGTDLSVTYRYANINSSEVLYE